MLQIGKKMFKESKRKTVKANRRQHIPNARLVIQCCTDRHANRDIGYDSRHLAELPRHLRT